MIEEVLQTSKAAMEAGLGSESSRLEGVKGQMNELASVVTEAEAAVASQKEVVEAANTSVVAAASAANASLQALEDQRSVQKSGDARLASAKEEKLALEMAVNDHFKAPMEASQGPNFQALE